MRRILFFTVMLLCWMETQQTYAQRHLPLQKGIQAAAGTVNGVNLNTRGGGFGCYGGITWVSYTKSGGHWLIGGEFLQKRHLYEGKGLPQVQFTGEGGYFVDIFSTKNKIFYCSLGLSALGGYETINWNKKLLFDGAAIKNKDAFLYGGAATLESEFFFSEYSSLLFNIRERVLAGSSVDIFNTQVGLGVRVYY